MTERITVSRLHRPNTGYTLLSNDFLRNGEIPQGAFRLACYMLTHTESFEMTQESIGEVLGMVRNSVAKHLRWLESARYVVSFDKPRDAKGRKAGKHYYISEEGISEEERQALCAKNAHGQFDPAAAMETMRKKVADPCAKVEQHKKTISKKTTSFGPVADSTTDRARIEKDESSTGATRSRAPKAAPAQPAPRKPRKPLKETYAANKAAGIGVGTYPAVPAPKPPVRKPRVRKAPPPVRAPKAPAVPDPADRFHDAIRRCTRCDDIGANLRTGNPCKHSPVKSQPGKSPPAPRKRAPAST